MIGFVRGIAALPFIGLWLLEGRLTGTYPPRRMEPVVRAVLGT